MEGLRPKEELFGPIRNKKNDINVVVETTTKQLGANFMNIRYIWRAGNKQSAVASIAFIIVVG